MRLAYLATAVLLVGIVFPAGAQAVSGTPSAGPVLAGDRVVWAESAFAAPVRLFAAPVTGGPRRAGATLPAVEGQDNLRLAASGSRVALSRSASFAPGPPCSSCDIFAARESRALLAEARTGPFAGPLEPLVRCTGANQYGASAVAVAGGTVAHSRGGCSTGRRDRVQIVPERGPRSVLTQPNGARVVGLALAGTKVAYTRRFGGRSAELVLYDRVSERQLLRVGGVERKVDVQADGVVAFTVAAKGSSGCRRWAAWASPAEPVVHRLPGCAGRPGIRVAGGRVAYVREVNGLQHRLVLTRLDGREHAVAVFARSTTQIGDFDFDGRRVTWATEGCYRGDIRAAGLADPTRPASRGDIRCPVRFPTGPVVASSEGFVDLVVRCSRGCDGQILFYDPRTGHDSTTNLDGFDLALPPGGSRVLRVRLAPALRHELASRGRVRVRVAVVAESANSGGGGGPYTVTGGSTFFSRVPVVSSEAGSG